MKSNRGITLLEILIVIVIVGIMTAISLPLLSTSKKTNTLINASSEVKAMITLAKDLAKTKNVPHSIIADYAANTVRIEDDSNNLYGKIWRSPNTINIYGNAINNTTEEGWTFSTRGSASYYNTMGSLHLESNSAAITNRASTSKEERAKCHTLTVNLSTGRVNFYKYGRNTPWSSSAL